MAQLKEDALAGSALRRLALLEHITSFFVGHFLGVDYLMVEVEAGLLCGVLPQKLHDPFVVEQPLNLVLVVVVALVAQFNVVVDGLLHY